MNGSNYSKASMLTVFTTFSYQHQPQSLHSSTESLIHQLHFQQTRQPKFIRKTQTERDNTDRIKKRKK